MLTFVCCAYNEARQLPMMLASLPRGARVVLLDGAYAEYPHDNPASTDGTIDIARRFGCELVTVSEPWPDQVAKRTASLAYGDVFIIDADEVLEGSIVLPDADVGWVEIRNPIYRHPYDEPRLFRAREGWHYDKRHHWVYDGDARLVASHRVPGEDYRHAHLGVKLHNMRHWRDAGRIAEKGAYSVTRNAAELVHRCEVAS